MKMLQFTYAANRLIAAFALVFSVTGIASAQTLRMPFPEPSAPVEPAVQQPYDPSQGMVRVNLRNTQPETPTPTPTPGNSTALPAPAPAPVPGLVAGTPVNGPEAGVAVGGCGTGDCNHPVVKRRCGPFSLRAQLRAKALCPPPIGSAVATIFETQRVAAMSEYFVIYMEDWIEESAVLNSSGERHFTGILKRFHTLSDPIRIEPIGKDDDVVNAKRKAAIIDYLIAVGVPEISAKSRVVIGRGRAEGLRYSDIEGLVGQSGGVGSFGSGGGGGGASSALQSLGGFGGLLGSGAGGFR